MACGAQKLVTKYDVLIHFLKFQAFNASNFIVASAYTTSF